jgi:hypothetical protein
VGLAMLTYAMIGVLAILVFLCISEFLVAS